MGISATVIRVQPAADDDYVDSVIAISQDEAEAFPATEGAMQCPDCACWLDDTLIACTTSTYDHAASMNNGGYCKNWTEIHACPECGEWFSVESSNY